MVRVVRPLILWYEIRGAGLRFVSLIFVLMLTWRLFLVLLFLNHSWIHVHAGRIADDDVAAWPYSVGILIGSPPFLVFCTGLLVLVI